jgi:hypothetical protein
VRPVESDLCEVLLPAVLRGRGTWHCGLPASGPSLRTSTDWESADGLRQALNELTPLAGNLPGEAPSPGRPLCGPWAAVRPVESDLYEVLLPAVLRGRGTWLRGLPVSGPPLRVSTDWESADSLRQALNELVRPGRLTLGSTPFGFGPFDGRRTMVPPVESDLCEVLLPAVLRGRRT